MDRMQIQSQKRLKEGFIGQRMIVLPPNIKRKITTNEISKHFYLTAIGFYPNAINHDRIRKTGSSQYILLYCIEGKGAIVLDGDNYELSANTFFIIPKNQSHHYYSSTKNPWSIYWVHFMGDVADELYKRYQIDGKPSVYTIPFQESRLHLFDLIFVALVNGFTDREMEIMNLNLLQFVSSMIYFKENSRSIANNDRIDNSIAFMREKIHEKLSIEDFSSQQSFSVSHYSRLFKEKTGASPIGYFNQLKIQKACQYIYFTDQSLKEICSQLGFEDQYYFSRLFHKIIGSSPSAYKKRHKR
jgi:AraC family transcriptional regulator of arabinose operon